MNKQTIIKTVLIFLISYLMSMLIWVQVKDYYGYAITLVASRLVSGIKDAKLEEIVQRDDIIQATFSSPFSRNPDILIDIPVKTSTYTFNAPLTFGIMATLYLFIKRKGRAYIEAIVILLFVHLLYIMSHEANQLTEKFMVTGLETVSKPRVFIYQFLWGFTDNMIIRFEPFLIGFYMFIRFRK